MSPSTTATMTAEEPTALRKLAKVSTQPSSNLPKSPPNPSSDAEPIPPAEPTPTPNDKKASATEPSKQKDEEESLPAPSASSDAEIIDMETFDQIIELDDEDSSHEFSKEMVSAYFDQAKQTFADIDAALTKEDLKELSSLGHFLKGSSAALGLRKVQSTCEKIQHYGLQHDDEKDVDLSREEALSRIVTLREQVREEYSAAKNWLERWFEENVKKEDAE
ncbi:hypothetical protein H0H92_002226 [Tricholoma furcatifolium]|nr:hypothetical protein H0H92_002226 [Tricholoma furcatifolium]